MTCRIFQKVIAAVASSGSLWAISCAFAYAQPAVPVAEIAATVSAEIQQDQVQLVLSARVQKDDAAQVSRQLNQMIDAARIRLGQPQDVRISTGNIQTYPNYDQQGKIVSWQGRADIVLQSADVSAVTDSADRIADLLVVSGVNFSLSDAARRAQQSRMMEEVAQAFRDKAAMTAKVFGYSSYQIQRLNVAESGDAPSFRPMMAAMAADTMPKASISLVPGVETVSVTVNGVIELR